MSYDEAICLNVACFQNLKTSGNKKAMAILMVCKMTVL
jgi:hypothetical protein